MKNNRGTIKRFLTLALVLTMIIAVIPPITALGQPGSPGQVTITVRSDPPAGGTAIGGGVYQIGVNVMLNITQSSGYRFDGWYEEGKLVSRDKAYSFVASVNRSFVAQFTDLNVIVEAEQRTFPNPHTKWADVELLEAESRGLIPDSLKDTSIDYRNSITRVEFAGIIVKTYESLAKTTTTAAATNPFTDTSNTDALKAYNAGLMVGVSDTEFRPNAILTRQEAATALTRVYKKAKISGWTLDTDSKHPLDFTHPVPFTDHEEIAPWAKESVDFMSANRVIQGTNNTIDNNSFQPRVTCTREQAVAIALRMINNLG